MNLHLPKSRLVSLLTTGLLSILLAPAASAQIEGGNGEGELIIIDSPPTIIGDFERIGVDTILNVDEEGSIGDFFNAGISGLNTGPSDPPDVNGEAAALAGRSPTSASTVVNIFGGTVGNVFNARDNSEINIYGGTVGDDFNAHQHSHVNIYGGSVGGWFQAHGDSTVDIFGGHIGEDFFAFAGSTINLFGTEFSLGGELLDLSNSITQTILERDVTLSGIFEDGSPFSFDLNSTFSMSDDYFDVDALLTVTVTESDVFELRGDYNDSGVVEQGDLDLVLMNWGASASQEPDDWINDLPTGLIDQDELDKVLRHYGEILGGGHKALTVGAVPEPTSQVLLLVIALLAGLFSPIACRRAGGR